MMTFLDQQDSRRCEGPAGVLTWAEIDLEAIAFNVSGFKRHVGEAVAVIAVVKANAYGHGAVQVAGAALSAGATRLGVHRVEEGAALRRAGISAPILVMGYTPLDGVEAALAAELTPTVTTLPFAQALSRRAAGMGRVVPVHVKIDSGMSRFGLMPDEAVDFLRAIGRLPGLALEGLFTHFATADSADLTHTHAQLKVFREVIAAARQAGFTFPLIHACNSAAAMALPEAHFNAVRPGIGLYGLLPSEERPPAFTLRPALSLKSRVARVQVLPAGCAVSYGRTYITQAETRTALIPVGYGDGLSRARSNRGSVLIRGQRAAVIGRVCMDQIVVDASRIPDIQVEDEAVVIGRQGGEQISAEEAAQLTGTINYEVTTALLPRVARVYLRGGAGGETTRPDWISAL